MHTSLRTPLVIVSAAALALTACSTDGADGDRAQVAVSASDDACVIDPVEVEAGSIELTVTNDGSQVTEVYVYADEDQVVGEVENVTPGLARSFVVSVGGGTYEVACKPGQTGDGIRTDLTVTGEEVAALEPTREIAFTGVDYGYQGLEDASFAAGDVVEFEMLNEGTVEHEFEVFGPDGAVLGEIGPTEVAAEGKVTLVLGEAGTYRYVCGIDDHEERGMVGEFTVEA